MHTTVGCSEGHPTGNIKHLSFNNNEGNKEIHRFVFLCTFRKAHCWW